MQSFDIVMEKAYDADMEGKMKNALSTMKNIKASEMMKNAKASLKEARKLAKSGNIKDAKIKYAESYGHLLDCANALSNAYGTLKNSGSVKGQLIRVLVAYIATLGVSLAGFFNTLNGAFSENATKQSNARNLGIQIGTSGLALLAQSLYYKKLNKDNDKNYKKFIETVKEDPEGIFKSMIADVNKMAKSVKDEMNAL